MYKNAEEKLKSCIVNVDNWEQFMTNLNQSKTLFTSWCNTVDCENDVADKSAAESKENPNEA